MTVAEQTLETYEDDGSELAKVVLSAKAARDRGEQNAVMKVDLALETNAGYDVNPLMESLMTLGFSRSWSVSEDGQWGTLVVSW